MGSAEIGCRRSLLRPAGVGVLRFYPVAGQRTHQVTGSGSLAFEQVGRALLPRPSPRVLWQRAWLCPGRN